MDGKRDWMRGLTLALCVVLLLLSFGQWRRISDLEQDIWNAQNSIMDNVSHLEDQVASLYSDLENADNLVLDWSYTPALNREKMGLDVEVTVKLKEWTEDTALELLWTSLGSTDSKGVLSMVCDGAGSFIGKLEIPLDGSRIISLDAVIQNGDTWWQERLGDLRDTAMLLPVQCSESYGISGPEYEQSKDGGGVFTISNFHTGVYGYFEKAPKITGQAFHLLRNGELVAELAAESGDAQSNYFSNGEPSPEPAAKPEGAQGDYFGNGKLTTECQKGDVLTWTFFCRDESGVGYEFFLKEWSIGEDGLERNAQGAEWPKLTWD